MGQGTQRSRAIIAYAAAAAADIPAGNRATRSRRRMHGAPGEPHHAAAKPLPLRQSCQWAGPY